MFFYTVGEQFEGDSANLLTLAIRELRESKENLKVMETSRATLRMVKRAIQATPVSRS